MFDKKFVFFARCKEIILLKSKTKQDIIHLILDTNKFFLNQPYLYLWISTAKIRKKITWIFHFMLNRYSTLFIHVVMFLLHVENCMVRKEEMGSLKGIWCFFDM